MNVTYTNPSPSLTPPRTPARRARGGRPTEVDGFDEPLHPVGCEIGTIIQGLTVRAPSKGRVVPHCHPLVVAASCLISKTGGSSLVRSASCGEWPAQHAEVRWKIKYLYMFFLHNLPGPREKDLHDNMYSCTSSVQ